MTSFLPIKGVDIHRYRLMKKNENQLSLLINQKHLKSYIMAKIILAPNESFEHFHSEVSTTTLLEGSAHYRAGEVEYMLERDVPVLTPANQSHILTNTGGADCVLGCAH